jgi:proline iminopeptidase
MSHILLEMLLEMADFRGFDPRGDSSSPARVPQRVRKQRPIFAINSLVPAASRRMPWRGHWHAADACDKEPRSVASGVAMTTILTSRRRFVTGALAALASPGAAASPAPPGQLVAVRGTRLFIDDSGPRDAPALLYLHGGPGAGSYDFQLYQRDRLNRALRVVIMDQRGVLRSDPIVHMRMNDLVEDCEAVRQALGIRTWCVLGHSFGGQVALRYAVAHPSSLRGVVFENSSFSIASSVRSLLRGARKVAIERSRHDVAASVDAIFRHRRTSRQLWDAFGKIGSQLGPERERLYVHQPALRGFFERMQKSSGLGDALWARAAGQVAALTGEGRIFDDLMPWLSRMEACALLLHGDYDYVAAADQRQAFLHSGRNRQIEHFADSAHFIHVEEPDVFARSVIQFVSDPRTPRPA